MVNSFLCKVCLVRCAVIYKQKKRVFASCMRIESIPNKYLNTRSFVTEEDKYSSPNFIWRMYIFIPYSIGTRNSQKSNYMSKKHRQLQGIGLLIECFFSYKAFMIPATANSASVLFHAHKFGIHNMQAAYYMYVCRVCI